MRGAQDAGARGHLSDLAWRRRARGDCFVEAGSGGGRRGAARGLGRRAALHHLLRRVLKYVIRSTSVEERKAGPNLPLALAPTFPWP